MFFSGFSTLGKAYIKIAPKGNAEFGDSMNKKTIYIIVAVVIVVIVVAGAGILLLNNGGNGGEPEATPTPTAPAGVASATSIKFTVTDSTGTYTYSAKNLDSDALVRIENESGDFILIVNCADGKASMYAGGEWIEDDFTTWSDTWTGYFSCLADWTEGDWTSEDGTISITDITLNPTLEDSIFEVPS